MEYSFNFYLVTAYSIQPFFFEWKVRNHHLHMKILNTICGWGFERDWKDDEYKYPVGKVVKLTGGIIAEVEQLKNDFLNKKEDNGHKQLICSLYNTLSELVNGELFFIYRITYNIPTQKLLVRICNELKYIKEGKTKGEADGWFNDNASVLFDNYDFSFYSEKKQGVFEKNKRICRFCGTLNPQHNFHL